LMRYSIRIMQSGFGESLASLSGILFKVEHS